MSPSFLEALQSGMEISAPFNFSMKSSSGTGKSGSKIHLPNLPNAQQTEKGVKYV